MSGRYDVVVVGTRLEAATLARQRTRPANPSDASNGADVMSGEKEHWSSGDRWGDRRHHYWGSWIGQDDKKRLVSVTGQARA